VSPQTVGVSTGSNNEIMYGTVRGEFKDTFGVSNPKYLPVYDDSAWDEILACKEFTSEKLSDVVDGTANFYGSTKSFSEFQGIDLIPENKEKYLRAPITGKMYYDKLNYNDARGITKELVLRSCSVASKEDGWTWNIQQVGPFESHGNYDWWQIGWHDMGKLKPVLEKHPQGIIIDKHIMVPVEDGTRKRLGHPPIHIHHIHVCADRYGKSVRPRHGFKSYNVSLAVEQHGDYQCIEEEGGLDCLAEQNPRNTGRLVTTPLDLEGELNDVRAPRSEKLVWWYEVAVRWTPDVKSFPPDKQISMQFIVGPGRLNLFDQSSYVVTFPTPTNTPTFYVSLFLLGLFFIGLCLYEILLL
jgi:hypothetical protein